ncbi:MAG: cellobiose phosphorylase [Fervidobacterium sp.]|uniref:cellobiose phosphorylase n=1 Tax=Fervidobacterium sp. TaxID=1871331 RepID=UPI0030A11E7B
MAKYYFNTDDRFVIEDYNNSKPFASFLPGIAGKQGIPLWVFYVNRAQCIASFGLAHKDNPIMEFHPAFRSYQTVYTNGFRTFIKVHKKNILHEAFVKKSEKITQKMYIARESLEIEEINEEIGLKTNVLYFTLPQEKLAALVRKVVIENISSETLSLEVLDGLSTLLPFGINDYGLKHVGNTLKAWMEVIEIENGVHVFKLRSTAEDVATVSEIREGNFYVSFKIQENDKEQLKPLVDPDVVFGFDNSYISPQVFAELNLEQIKGIKQVMSNRVPCAFSPVITVLEPGQKVEIYTVVGHASNTNLLVDYSKKFSDSKYLEDKYHENRQITEDIVSRVWIKTGSKLFDEYVKQNYLDNVLRGGYPVIVRNGENSLVYHIYSRKHGDLERDYNYFVLLPEYYSSGNANYRDVNQNRREDVFFNPEVERYNIRFFMNLIQTDGYNPLVINGIKYRVDVTKLDKLSLDDFFEDVTNVNLVVEFLKSHSFTPGKLLKFFEDKNIKLRKDFEEFLRYLGKYIEEEIDAVHGEGYWTDHWTYNLDLIESYLSIYPDHKEELLFNDETYTYYDNAHCVLPRSKRYVVADGKIRQYKSTYEDQEKKKLIESRTECKNVMRKAKGTGEIYRTSLIVKLINLAVVKFATLDPSGVGIEMEAGKPGWYDALNGLPGLFGSSVADSFELLRLLDFVINTLKEYPQKVVKLPAEVLQLVNDLVGLVREYNESNSENKDFDFWDKISTLREKYREETKFGFIGDESKVPTLSVAEQLEVLTSKLRKALNKAIEENDHLMPTYFYYEVENYVVEKEGSEDIVKVLKFSRKSMPLFLEGIVRGMKVYKEPEILKNIYSKVKSSGLYDRKLRMYKVNASLENQSIEIGRAKAFTPGWLENESIWVHMEYKYMLELLRSGLYDEFFEDFKNVMIAFLDPAIYGRSPLENSSFIASSANPDEKVHGTGFVARLSGATAEFLSIWRIMMAGKNPFRVDNGKLVLVFEPVLPGWLFDENNKISFKFLGNCTVTYVNPDRLDTYKVDYSKQRVTLFLNDGERISLSGGLIEEKYAKMVRNGKVDRIEILITQ